MPASQPIDIPDAKKRNKKKKRCRATDSFSGRFEGECERVYQGLKVCVRARVCASFMVMLPLFTQSWYRSHPAFVIVVIQTLPILLIRLPLSTPICFSTKTARRFRVCSLQRSFVVVSVVLNILPSWAYPYYISSWEYAVPSIDYSLLWVYTVNSAPISLRHVFIPYAFPCTVHRAAVLCLASGTG